MSTPSTETTDRTDHGRGAETSGQGRARRAVSAVRNRGRSGSTAMFVGGTLLARAVRTMRRNRGRAAIQALIGGALVAFGLRRRRSGSGTDTPVGGSTTGGGSGSMVDAARSAVDRVTGGSELSPRGVSGEPDVETETDPDEGPIQFTDEPNAEVRSKPHLDEPGADDPRRHEEENEVDIDVSEAALADEASEAVGPDPEQAQPASTEGTEPEPTPAEDASHMQADEPDGTDEASDESGDDDVTFGDESVDESGASDDESSGDEENSEDEDGI